MQDKALRIRWAPKASRAKIWRLYQTEARGIVDEELIDEVGTALYERCQSIIMVTEGKRAVCPRCNHLIICPGERWSKQYPIVCPICSWRATYGQWRHSWRHQDLHGGNAMYAFRTYVEQYEQAKSPRERVLLIDQLIHAYHWSMRRNRHHGPVANQLIQGSRDEVLAFLDKLTYGDTNTSLNMNPKKVVKTGYDAVSYAYRGDVEDDNCTEYHAWLDVLIPHLSLGTAVLDLGCGCAIPVARRLAATHQVTGVDISPRQIERARQLAPAGHFLCADMMRIDFPPASFEAIVSFYAIIHLPLAEQPLLFRKLHRWLKPGGYLMATLGSTAWTGTEEDWLGVLGATMYWSHTDTTTYQSWLTESNFEICWTRFIPEGNGGHTLVLARSIQSST